MGNWLKADRFSSHASEIQIVSIEKCTKFHENLTSHYGSAKRPIQWSAGERFNSGCSVSPWSHCSHCFAESFPLMKDKTSPGLTWNHRNHPSNRFEGWKFRSQIGGKFIDLCSKGLSRELTNPIQKQRKRPFRSFHKCTKISLTGGNVLPRMLSQISYSFLSPSSLRQNSTSFTTFLFTATWAILLICIFRSSSSMKPNEITNISDQIPGQVHGSSFERSRSGHGRSNTSINHLRERSIRR